MNNNRFYILVGITFAIISALIIFIADGTVFNRNICLMGNTFFAFISLLMFYLSAKKINSTNSAKFVYGFLSLSMLRLFLSIIGIVILVLIFKKTIHKANYFALLFFYMLYTFLETGFILKLNKQNK